ncbi:MAG TPA: hypothetical protein PK971_09225, partial [Saprospiraceae bacterium]|nr:hypothetical protein [Saprospiraceae bacterium]
MRQLLFPLYALLGLCLPAHAQVLPQPRIFSLADVRQEMCALRKASVEHIIVRGDHTPEGDRRMVQELEAFLQSPLGSADGRLVFQSAVRAAL